MHHSVALVATTALVTLLLGSGGALRATAGAPAGGTVASAGGTFIPAGERRKICLPPGDSGSRTLEDPKMQLVLVVEGLAPVGVGAGEIVVFTSDGKGNAEERIATFGVAPGGPSTQMRQRFFLPQRARFAGRGGRSLCLVVEITAHPSLAEAGASVAIETLRLD